MATAIFDGNFLLHRVMHIPQLRVLSTKDGKPTGGVFGAIKSIRSTLYRWSEISSAVMVFDGGKSVRRMNLYPDYKANRRIHVEEDPDGIPYLKKFIMQQNYLKFLLPKLGIRVIILKGKEGDDLIALIAKLLDNELTIVSSDDRDMFQLINSHTHLWRPIAEERIYLGNFEEYAGCSPDEWLLRKAVIGDSSDNIKGIKGVGSKTVDDVIKNCGGVGSYPFDNFFEYAMLHKSKRYNAIAENIDRILLNYELIDISKESFSDDEINEVKLKLREPIDFQVGNVKKLFESFEFYSVIEDFNRWITKFQMLV